VKNANFRQSPLIAKKYQRRLVSMSVPLSYWLLGGSPLCIPATSAPSFTPPDLPQQVAKFQKNLFILFPSQRGSTGYNYF
jgi:hypothetical protein